MNKLTSEMTRLLVASPQIRVYDIWNYREAFHVIVHLSCHTPFFSTRPSRQFILHKPRSPFRSFATMLSYHVYSRPTMTNPTTRTLLSNGFAIFNYPHPHRALRQKSNAQICPNTGSFVRRGTPSLFFAASTFVVSGPHIKLDYARCRTASRS